MKVLVINCGSSSLKFQLINSDNEKVLAKGLCERIGISGSAITYESVNCEKNTKEIDMPKESVVFALEAIQDPISLFEPVYHDGTDVLYVMDQVKDDKNTDTGWIDNISLKEAISKLNDREKNIINLRFFKGKTQMEVSEEIGISQAQVSRLEKNALKTMRKYV